MAEEEAKAGDADRARGCKRRSLKERLDEHNFSLAQPCVGRNYRKKPLRQLSSEDLSKLYRLYNDEFYPRSTVARILQVSEGLVTRVASAIDKDKEFVSKR